MACKEHRRSETGIVYMFRNMEMLEKSHRSLYLHHFSGVFPTPSLCQPVDRCTYTDESKSSVVLSFPAGIDAYSYRCAIKNSSWVADPFFSLPPPPPPYFSLIHHIPSGISHGSATDSIITPSSFDAPHSNDDSPLLDSRIRWTGAFAVCYAVHALDEGTWKWTIAATGNKVTFGQIKQNVDSDCRHCSHCLLWL